MNWLFDHTEVVTLIAAIAMPILLIGLMLLMSGKTPEASDLQGAPKVKEQK